jgi:zinc transporter ZupT
MNPAVYAYVLGTASGLSLIIGAIMGCKMAPVSDRACSAMMAFGAGALLFAVTIELYAHALHKLKAGHMQFVTEMLVILVCAQLGATFYLWINKLLEEYLMAQEGGGSQPATPTATPRANMADTGKPKKKDDAHISHHSDHRHLSAGETLHEAELLVHESASHRERRLHPGAHDAGDPEKGIKADADGSPKGADKDKGDIKSQRKKSVLLRGNVNDSLAQTANLPPARPRRDSRTFTPTSPSDQVPSRVSGETEDEKKARLRARARSLWKKAKFKVMFFKKVQIASKSHARGRERGIQDLLLVIQDWGRKFGQAPEQDPDEEEDEERQKILQHAKLVAMQLFLGLLVDGVPEAVLMGFLAAQGHLTPVLIVALFFANFPEAFSSASLLTVAKMSWYGIVGMWTFLCIIVGIIAGISCWALISAFPGYASGEPLPTPVLMGIAAIEGLTGGSMIACIAAVMLPEAFERMGKDPPLYMSSGFMCTGGFLSAVLLKSLTD